MKGLKKVVSVLLVASMAMGLASCSKLKAIDKKEFKEACKSNLGAKSDDISDWEDSDDNKYYTYSDGKHIYVRFIEFDDEDDAADYFDDMYDDVEDAIDDGDIEGKTKLVNNDTWGYVIVKGEDDDGDDIYAACYFVDNQIIYITCDSLKDKQLDKVTGFLKDLGLPRL